MEHFTALHFNWISIFRFPWSSFPSKRPQFDFTCTNVLVQWNINCSNQNNDHSTSPFVLPSISRWNVRVTLTLFLNAFYSCGWFYYTNCVFGIWHFVKHPQTDSQIHTHVDIVLCLWICFSCCILFNLEFIFMF